MVNSLAEEGMLDCLNLLHFHVGSQITNIRMVKEVGAGGSGSWWVLWGIVKEVGAGASSRTSISETDRGVAGPLCVSTVTW